MTTERQKRERTAEDFARGLRSDLVELNPIDFHARSEFSALPVRCDIRTAADLEILNEVCEAFVHEYAQAPNGEHTRNAAGGVVALIISCLRIGAHSKPVLRKRPGASKVVSLF